MATQLATLADVRQYLAITGTGDDALLTRLIDVCSNSIEKWCSRTFGAADYSLTLDGTGKERITLETFPVISVSSVTVSGVPIPRSTGVTSPGFFWSQWKLHIRGGGVFERGTQNVEVNLRAGYEQIPADLAQACIKLVALRYKERDRLGISAKTIAGETVHFANDDFPESIERVLNDYKGVITL